MRPAPFFYPYAFGLFTADRDDLGQRMLAVPDTHDILLWSQEAQRAQDLQHWIDFVDRHDLAHRVRWLLQPSHVLDPDQARWLGSRLHLIDLDLLLLDLHVHAYQTSVPNHCWIADTGRFLFPTGKADRPNRIRLLYKFHQAGLESRCDWSLFLDDSSRQRCRALVPELDDLEFAVWLQRCLRSIDQITVASGPGGSTHSQGYPFDGQCYATTSFRVISETQMLDATVVTEKTWITMINRVPFIMSGYAGSLDYLRSQGYRTFDRYLACSEYDTIQDQEQRLDAVVANTRFWLDHILDHEPEIRADVEHNFRLLMMQIHQAREQGQQLAALLGHLDRGCHALVPLSIEQHNWVNFYYGVKDPAWPECWLPEGWHQLPREIQAECVHQFGYIPPDKH